MIRSSNLFCVAAVLAAFCAFCALFCGFSGEMRLYPQPSHAVLREWKQSNGRRYDLAGRTLTEDITLRTTLPQGSRAQCMMIKTNNIAVYAYTKGKVICKTADRGLALCGERITIIPLSDVQNGGEITLHLEVFGKSGSVLSPVYISTNNDLLLTLITREKRAVTALFALLAAIIITAHKAVLVKRKTAPLLCLLSAELSLFTSVLCRSDIAQFLTGSSLARLILIYTSPAAAILFFAAYCVLTFIQKRLPASYYR
ncbi:MAG: hypothetical protein IJR60_05655 [Eubacterium sp.]|nr:hypothetical protein [Eubacterium sp.]